MLEVGINMSYSHAQSHGLTVIELMVTLAVAAILVTIGLPTAQDFIRDNRMASQATQLVALVHIARSEAVQRNSNSICLRLSSPSGGWRGVAFERDGSSSCSDPPGLDLPRFRDITNDFVTFSEGTTAFRFNAMGRVSNDVAAPVVVNLVHHNCRREQRRRITINRMGRVSVERLACDAT